MKTLPLIDGYKDNTPLAKFAERTIYPYQFFSDVNTVAKLIPSNQYIINLCTDRYAFLVGFSATLIKGATNVLPHDQSKATLQYLREHYDAAVITDDATNSILHGINIGSALNSSNFDLYAETPRVDSDHTAALVFTSGTTGQAKANEKTWDSMVTIAKLTGKRFGIEKLHSANIIATVPQQHMYGLEASLMLPTQHGCCVYSGKPFFAEDIRQAMFQMEEPRILVTTPLHLRALYQERTQLPKVEFIISATAPLTKLLSSKLERRLNTKIYEIYGWTEAGTVATRRTVHDEYFRLLEGLEIILQDKQYVLEASYFPEPKSIDDTIQTKSGNRIKLLGRNSDMVNIAGKRASLADLNHKLNSIEGILDGVYYNPDDSTEDVTRLMAFVVAPTKTPEEIIKELRGMMDPAFLPRPLVMVNQLPRSSVGKIPRNELSKLATRLTPVKNSIISN